MRALVLVVAAACGSQNGTDSLVVTKPAGAGCATTGIEIDTGIDANHDAVLEPDEITSTSYVCAPSAPRELVRVVIEQPGANCPNGGQAIETGEDANGNGVLDPGEVSATSYVCSGADGVATLVRVDPAGSACAHGGSAIHTGLDANDNGVLDDSEITSTSYVCDGANGQVILVRVDPELAGDNCADGGTAIHVGIDANVDGALEDSEIESTSYLCGVPPLPSVIDGDYTVENDLDLARLGGVMEVTGSLNIHGDFVASLILPNLHHVGGSLRCIGESQDLNSPCIDLVAIDLPALTNVGDNMTGDASSGIHFWPATLTTFNLPNLATASEIYGSLVGELSLPALTSASITLSNSQLSSVVLPLLAHGGFAVSGNSGFTSLVLPAFVDGYIAVSNTPALTTISAPGFVSGEVGAADAPNLTSLSIPLFSSGEYLDLESTGLTSLPFPNLANVKYLSIIDNPAIPTCAAQAFALQTHAMNVTISGNDDAGVCP